MKNHIHLTPYTDDVWVKKEDCDDVWVNMDYVAGMHRRMRYMGKGKYKPCTYIYLVGGKGFEVEETPKEIYAKGEAE